MAALAVPIMALVAEIHAVRAPTGDTESELFYEASRVRRGLELFVDPVAGALDDGPFPVRIFQMYTPLWPTMVSVLPARHAVPIAHVAGWCAWFVGVPLLGVLVGRRNGMHALTVACSVTGCLPLAGWAFKGSPDPIAAFVAGAGLAIALLAGRLTAPAAVLLVTACALKPNVAGIALGVFALTAVEIVRGRAGRGALRATVAAALAGVAYLGWFMHTSRGAWLGHILHTTANGISLVQWGRYAADRLIILGAPHLALGVLAWRTAEPEDRSARLAAAALVSSTACAMFMMGKEGAAQNYWLEPTFALVLCLGLRGPGLFERARGKLRSALSVAGHVAPWIFVAWCAFALARFRVEQVEASTRRDRLAAWLDERGWRDRCRIGQPWTEFALTGRVTWAPWQILMANRRGTFALDPLERDITSPSSSCLVLPTWPSGSAVLFDGTALTPIVAANYRTVATVAGFRIWVRETP